MKIEDQVCTLEQAKMLKELGVAQESLFYWWWWYIKDFAGEGPKIVYQGKLKATGTLSNVQECCAYTVAEFGEMLPTGYDTMKITVNRDSCEWQGYDLDGGPFPSEQTYKTEAEVRADMLLALINSKLITVEEINNRLK